MNEQTVQKIDTAIEKVADDIANNNILTESLPDIITALAKLVSARATIL